MHLMNCINSINPKKTLQPKSLLLKTLVEKTAELVRALRSFCGTMKTCVNKMESRQVRIAESCPWFGMFDIISLQLCAGSESIKSILKTGAKEWSNKVNWGSLCRINWSSSRIIMISSGAYSISILRASSILAESLGSSTTSDIHLLNYKNVIGHTIKIQCMDWKVMILNHYTNCYRKDNAHNPNRNIE